MTDGSIPGITELLNCVNSFEFEEVDGWVVLQSFQKGDQAISIDLVVHSGQEHADRWKISCRECLDYRFRLGAISHLVIEHSHPLLWQFNESQRAIYFRGSCDESVKLIGELFLTHSSLVGNTIPFGSYLNTAGRLSDLLAGGYGLFAEGPKPLMDAYESVLTRFGLDVSGPPAHPARYWAGDHWADSLNDWQLFVAGDSYVVAREFLARR